LTLFAAEYAGCDLQHLRSLITSIKRDRALNRTPKNFRELFRALGFLDHPTQSRKIHTRPIPRAGGIAIASAYALTFLLLQLVPGIVPAQFGVAWKVLPSACVIFTVGLVDDIWGLKHWQKLIGQAVAAGIACLNGIVVSDVIGVHTLGWVALPATILWLLACTNAFNLVDGMDGLAAGVGMFATLTMFIAALLQGNEGLALATIVLAGCLLGFLRYNFNPATTFLGDSGSLLVGFTLGCYGIIWAQKSATLLGLTAPMMAVSIPLVDVSLAVARRFLRTQSIFSADRGHIHHRLLDRGMSPRKVALLFYGLSSIVAMFSLLQGFSHSNQVASVTVLIFCAFAWMGIQYLEYVEFRLAGRLLFGGELQKAVKARIDVENFSKRLTDVMDAESAYIVVAESAAEFGFTVLSADIAGHLHGASSRFASTAWTVRVQADTGDFVELSRENRADVDPAAAGLFLDALRIGLDLKRRPVQIRRQIKSLVATAG